jgi:hypothetical protein
LRKIAAAEVQRTGSKWVVMVESERETGYSRARRHQPNPSSDRGSRSPPGFDGRCNGRVCIWLVRVLQEQTSDVRGRKLVWTEIRLAIE